MKRVQDLTKTERGAINTEIVSQYRKITAEASNFNLTKKLVLSLKEDNLKPHKIHYLRNREAIQDIKEQIHQIKEDQKTDMDSRMPVTIMHQIQIRLRQEDTTIRAISDLEKKFVKMKVGMDKTPLQIEVQHLLLKQLIGSKSIDQTLDTKKKGRKK